MKIAQSLKCKSTGRLEKAKDMLAFNEKARSTPFDRRVVGDVAKEVLIIKLNPVFGVEMKRSWAL